VVLEVGGKSDHFVVCALMCDFIALCFLATGVRPRIPIKEILEEEQSKKGEKLLKIIVAPLQGL
jgi:hypothetical protein